MKNKVKAPEVVRNEHKFKVGDIVKLAPYYFDQTSKLIGRFQTIIEVETKENEGTSGQWVKTHLNQEWTDAYWYSHAKITLWDKFLRFLGLRKVPRQIRIRFDPAKMKVISKEEFNKKFKK